MSGKKISDVKWIYMLADKSGVDRLSCEKVWQAVVDIIVHNVRGENRQFRIPDFGTFMRVRHKGHPLNLGKNNAGTYIKDYDILKFKPSILFKNRILER